jgi:hypothetical protein
MAIPDLTMLKVSPFPLRSKSVSKIIKPITPRIYAPFGYRLNAPPNVR